jgi:hypothetical protein
MRQAGVKINAKHLGCWVTSRQGIQPMPKKFDEMMRLQEPKTREQLRGFMMAGPQVGGKVGGSTARTVCKTCNTCGEKGHQKITSKKCLMSTNSNSEHCKKGSLESRRPALEGECVMFS